MNRPSFPSNVKKRFEYHEATAGDEDDPNSPAYNFAAKFHRNRTPGEAKHSKASGGHSALPDSTPVKESLVVEQDPQAVKISFDQPPSAAYKAFVKSYLLETQNWCAFGSATVLLLLCIGLAILVQVLSGQVTEYALDYADL